MVRIPLEEKELCEIGSAEPHHVVTQVGLCVDVIRKLMRRVVFGEDVTGAMGPSRDDWLAPVSNVPNRSNMVYVGHRPTLTNAI